MWIFLAIERKEAAGQTYFLELTVCFKKLMTKSANTQIMEQIQGQKSAMHLPVSPMPPIHNPPPTLPTNS